MPKGFVRRLTRLLAVAWVVLGLPGAFSFPRPSLHPTWWELRLTATVKGGYTLKGGNTPVSGEYTCRVRWEGSLETDGDDFLLYHFKTEILEWRLAERTARPGGESLLEEKDADVKPALRLNYVLKDGPDVEVDFDLMGIPVPLHPSPVKVTLEFPSSELRRPLIAGPSYIDFVTRGSNRIVIPGSDLRRKAAERTFSWEWRRDKRVSAGPGALLVTERHTAEAVVSLVAH
jgi:hypothetical protein